MWHAILRSDLCQRIESGAVFTTPFPNHTVEESSSSSSSLLFTTVPERSDVLLGSRFDATFLGIYNRMLDYHPGNQRLQSLVTKYSNVPLHIATEGVWRELQKPFQGVVPRLLQQDFASGYWTVLSKDEVKETLRRELLMEQSPWIRFLAYQLKAILADGRFGTMRDTVMAQRFTPLFTTHWETVLLLSGETPTMKTNGAAATKSPSSRFALQLVAERPSTTNDRNTYHRLRNHLIVSEMTVTPNTNTEYHHVGDRVYADFERSGRFHEATIQNIHNSLFCHVEYATGEKERVLVQSLQTYRPIVQGDAVEVDIEDELFLATVTKVHPLGTYDDLAFDDGEEPSPGRPHERNQPGSPII
jgi:hypothetical protein